MARFHALLISPYKELIDVIDTVAGDFPDLDVTVHQGDLSRGLAAALGSIDSDYDVIISRGGTAQMLEDELSVPVIEIGISAADLYEALARHNPDGRRCAVVGFSNTLDVVREIAGFSDFDLDVYDVSFEDELPLVMEDVAEGAYEVVLCDTFSQTAFVERGMNAHLLTSSEASVSDALARAERFCEQTLELRSQNHVLWQLVRGLPSRVALFSDNGRLVYTNLTEHRDELLSFMREHLGGVASERLALQRDRRTYRLSKSSFEQDGVPYVAFNVAASGSPSSESTTGIERNNREQVERAYRESAFHIVGAEEALSPILASALRSGRPIALRGEVGTGKAHIAELLYLSGTRGSRPLVTVDCSLLTDKSWGYLADSPASPLYGSDETLWIKAAHALDERRARRLVGIVAQTNLCERDSVIVSANDEPAGGESRIMAMFAEHLRCRVITAPPLRDLPSIPRAVSLLLGAGARRTSSNPPFVTDEAMGLLAAHSWPRNYIEFARVLQHALADARDGSIGAQTVRTAIEREGAARFSSLGTPNEASSIDLLRPLRDIERDVVRMVVEKYNGNQAQAARTLGISRTTVWRLLRGE